MLSTLVRYAGLCKRVMKGFEKKIVPWSFLLNQLTPSFLQSLLHFWPSTGVIVQ